MCGFPGNLRVGYLMNRGSLQTFETQHLVHAEPRPLHLSFSLFSFMSTILLFDWKTWQTNKYPHQSISCVIITFGINKLCIWQEEKESKRCREGWWIQSRSNRNEKVLWWRGWVVGGRWRRGIGFGFGLFLDFFCPFKFDALFCSYDFGLQIERASFGWVVYVK